MRNPPIRVLRAEDCNLMPVLGQVPGNPVWPYSSDLRIRWEKVGKDSDPLVPTHGDSGLQSSCQGQKPRRSVKGGPGVHKGLSRKRGDPHLGKVAKARRIVDRRGGKPAGSDCFPHPPSDPAILPRGCRADMFIEKAPVKRRHPPCSADGQETEGGRRLRPGGRPSAVTATGLIGRQNLHRSTKRP